MSNPLPRERTRGGRPRRVVQRVTGHGITAGVASISTPPLTAPVASLWGVGSERAAQLARLGLHTLGDLLLHRPRRYEDRRHFKAIAELQLGEAATARGRIVALGVKRWRGGTKSTFEFILEDGTGRLHCRWWNLPFMQNYFQAGDEVLAYGKLESLRPRTMDHPETEVLESDEENLIHLNRLVPIYPLTEGLPQRWLRALLWRVVEQSAPRVAELFSGLAIPDLPSRAEAIRRLHFPEELTDMALARRRLALDEFLNLQVEIQRRRRRLQASARSLPCGGDNRLMRPFLKRLGFTLTDAQTKVLREIRHDLGGVQPMRRLLQGDVGSGKTVVAACGALMALEGGFNVALMAPTEILAGQHFDTFRQWFEPLGITVHLRTGTHKTGDELRPSHSSLAPRPSPLLCVGTQALLEDAVALDRLGLVIIDEQHKFGVAQRERLVRKGAYPHLLVMTATPIPRSLGLTLYGDLDLSVIDQLPKGRGPVRTFVRPADKLPKVWEFIRGQIARGRQAYVVYPRVEETDRGQLKAVTGEFQKLQTQLAPIQVGLLHGRLRTGEKEAVMDGFRAGKIQVLVATSVIEVGVDVANATVMLIEHAEQFGLAQLHQLRGRIGRGAHESFCILVAELKTEAAIARLRVLEESQDGFRIAEEDLRLRGPGELLGREQSGLPSFRFADLAEDRALLERARSMAGEILDRAGDAPGERRAGNGGAPWGAGRKS
jgi:ATP-dependent DNA helicase RecG